MILAALARERGDCRVLGLNAHRVGGVLRVGLLLCDGAVPAQDAPAQLFADETTEEWVTVRLPQLADAPYPDIELEVLEWQH